uniref:Uncharacterized protein n=1 Tax=Spongospora subterranea TaxID=70186 RepID=A0A0H5R967_9EUKA|eukprot:CRZ10673.1 hypothetical protein [Spongospora subterranea]
MSVGTATSSIEALVPGKDFSNELPAISIEEASDIRRYLQEHKLQVGEIHLLEGLLLNRLAVIDEENIRAMFSDEIAAQSLCNDVSKVQDATTNMDKWLRHYDRQLNRMKVGIGQIEHRNRLLDLQERNHTLLAETLHNLLKDLSLASGTLTELKSPSILTSNSLQSFRKTIDAAKELNGLLKRRFLNGLENLAAVREKRQEMEQIRKNFCGHAVTFFSQLFLIEQKKLSEHSHSEESVLPNTEKAHLSLGKYEELITVLESLDMDSYISVRQHYIRQFQMLHFTQFSSFFQLQKKLVLREKRDNGLNSMPLTHDNATISKASSSRSINKENKKVITDIFESSLECILPILVAEKEFCMGFFGVKQLEPTDGVAVDQGEEIDRKNEVDILEMMRLLFKGLEEELVALADKGDEMDHLYSLKMLVKVEQLQQEYDGTCAYVELLLSQLRSHTQLLFNEFSKEQLSWIETIKVSAKRCGILAPFAKLPPFIEKMEAAAAGHGPNRCATVDKTYVRIIDCMIAWLPQIAYQEPKYTTLVMMENSHFFWRFVSELSIPCLIPYQRKAYDMYKEHRDLYVSWSVKYAFPKVMEYFELLENTANSLSSLQDVPFTPGLSKQDLRTLLKTYLLKKKLQKAVNAMLQRAVKHLGEKGPLLPYIWTCMNDHFVSSFKRFESLVAQCYQAEEIELTVDDINAAFSSGNGEVLLEKLSESATSRSIHV